MAAVTGTVRDVFGFSTHAGPKKTTAGAFIETCIIDVTFSGTYASGDNASIANVHTAIASARRDGKTIAVVSAGFAAPGDLNAAAIGAKTVATSTNTVTAELTQADMSTEWADGALSTNWVEGVKFVVCYTAT
jgi:hypothetical protein